VFFAAFHLCLRPAPDAVNRSAKTGATYSIRPTLSTTFLPGKMLFPVFSEGEGVIPYLYGRESDQTCRVRKMKPDYP